MRPRILLRTHYQADEPRTIIAAVTECTSATESRHEEAIAAALVRWARKNGQVGKISNPGATYAVGNARSLGFLTNSNRWTATGLALAYIDKAFSPTGVQSVTLRPPEESLYLTSYLATGGALLITFGQWLMARGPTNDEEIRRGSVVEALLTEALDAYLRIATDIRDRTAIRRERDRLGRSEYAASTKRHKCYPLITTMKRLRLLEEEKDGDKCVIAPDSEGRLATLLRAIPDVASLERLAGDNSLPAVLRAALPESGRSAPWSPLPLQDLVARAYRFALDAGLQACPLTYLDDLLHAFAPGSTWQGRAEDLFEPLHQKLPGDVRFHVDRRGRRAFLLISREVSKNLEGLLTPFAPKLSS